MSNFLKIVQLAAPELTESICLVFQRRRWGATTLSVTFIPLSSSFFHSLHHSSRSPADGFSILRPPVSLFLTSILFSLSLNDLIPPMPFFSASASIFSYTIEFLSGSYPQGVDVTALILAGVNMSLLAALLCDSGKLAISECTMQEYNTHSIGFHDAF